MKCRLSALILALAVACALAAPASADVLWEPMNSFYDAHRDECEYEGRSYLANGAQGYVTILDAPGSAGQVYNVPNAESIFAGYRWTAADGTRWYACEYALPMAGGEGWDWKQGWAPASEIALIYDHLCFEEDHGDEFAEYDGSGDALKKVCLYSYPGGMLQNTLEEDQAYQPFAETFEKLYTDEQGRRWAFIGYYMGRQNAWACLDDPLNEDLGTGVPQTVFQVRGGEGPNPVGSPSVNQELVPPAEDVPEAKTFPIWLLPSALVVAAAAVTAVLIGRRKGA